MTLIKNTLVYMILGLVQGFSEPIPISSSGHLVIFKAIFENHLGIEFPSAANDMAFDVLLHLASLLAIMFYYRYEIIDLIKSFFTFIFTKKGKKDRDTAANFRFCIYLVIATIPAAIGGVLFEDKIDVVFQNVKLVGCALIVTSVFLMLLHIYGPKGKRTKKNMRLSDAIIMGIFQLVALVPGISRSGSTMTGGMFSGLSQKSSRDFSFFMFMPVALGSVVLKLDDFLASPLKTLWFPYLMAFITATITTYIALMLLFAVLKKRKMNYFSIYCFIMGLIAIFLI